MINAQNELYDVEKWTQVQNQLFPNGWPSRHEWTSVNDIIGVLNLLCTDGRIAQCLFPQTGGEYLRGCSPSSEEGCIELDFVYIYVAKPKALIYENLGSESESNYFWLQLDVLKPTGVADDVRSSDYIEDVLEVAPNEYIDPDSVDYSEDGDSGLRSISRYLRGDILILSNASPYYEDSTTYDARHAGMSHDEFRVYVLQYLKDASSDFLMGDDE